MPDWNALFGDASAAAVALWIVAALLAVGVIIKLWPFVRNAVAIVDALVQLPSFIARTDATLQAHTKQIENSHSTNLRDDITEAVDAVERVELGVKGLYGKVDDLYGKFDDLTQADADIRAELEDTQNPKENR